MRKLKKPEKGVTRIKQLFAQLNINCLVKFSCRFAPQKIVLFVSALKKVLAAVVELLKQ